MDDPSASSPSSPDAEPPSVEDLVAERDALRAQVDALAKPPRRRGRLRGVVAVSLVFVFALTFLAGGVGLWLHRNTLNDDVWAERVVPLGEEPEVQAALARWTSAELMATLDPKSFFEENLPERAAVLAVPLTSAVRGFVTEKVEEFFASDRFEKVWATAATRAHEFAVDTLRGDRPEITAGDKTITINLIPMINDVLAIISREAPGLIGSDATLPTITVDDVPAVAREKLAGALGVNLDDDFGVFTVYDDGQLAAAQQAVEVFDTAVVVFMVLAVLSFAGALWASQRRRRTLLQLMGATVIMCILIRRVAFLLQEQVLDLVRIEENRGAVGVVLASVVDPLTSAAATVLWVVAAVVAVALVTGPYPWAVALRGLVTGTAGSLTEAVGGKARAPETAVWITTHADALRLAGYGVGVLALWFVDLSWATLLLIGLAVAAWQVFLYRLAPTTEGEATPGDEGPVPPLPPVSPQQAGG